MSYKLMTWDHDEVGWEDDSFASGWTWYDAILTVTRDGDIVAMTLLEPSVSGHIEKTGLNINAATYKYLVVCVKGTDQFFLSIYDGEWKNVTTESAPAEFDVKVYDLSSITTGTISGVRLGVKNSPGKKAYYDFVAFCRVQPQFCTDKVISLFVRQRETDVDEFEIVGTDDIGSGLTIGRHLRIFLRGLLSGTAGETRKVFAGVIEESTPEDTAGRVLRITGRCFGQKLLLRTKSKNFNAREVSLAVKDLVEDLTEVSTYQVETPSPAVYITKDFAHEYILDALRDLAKQAGSDWEVKLGMGQDLRFRSRSSANVPLLSFTISEAEGHVLRNVRKETDGYRAYNKVTVLGGELRNFNSNDDEFTDDGDIANYSWQAFDGGVVTYDSDYVAGKWSIWTYWNDYVNVMTSEFDLGSDGKDLTIFRYFRWHHRGTIYVYPATGTTFHFELRLRDTQYRNASKSFLANSTQPPTAFAEVIVELTGFTEDSGFDWTHVRFVQFRCVSNRTGSGEGVRGEYYVDKFFFHAPNIKKTANADNDFRHTREYVYRDEKIVDPDFAQEVANALLTVLKGKENRYQIPILGSPEAQAGRKASVNIPSHGLIGTYYICEALHRINPRDGYVTEVVLEAPSLTLEGLLTQSIERQIKRLERSGVS